MGVIVQACGSTVCTWAAEAGGSQQDIGQAGLHKEFLAARTRHEIVYKEGEAEAGKSL